MLHSIPQQMFVLRRSTIQLGQKCVLLSRAHQNIFILYVRSVTMSTQLNIYVVDNIIVFGKMSLCVAFKHYYLVIYVIDISSCTKFYFIIMIFILLMRELLRRLYRQYILNNETYYHYKLVLQALFKKSIKCIVTQN